MTRIAFVATGGLDQSGRHRVIPALLWLVERLARRHRVDVYVLRYLDRPIDYPLAGATVHDLGSPRGLVRQSSALVNALRRDGPFDVLHAYWALPAGLASAVAGRRLGVPSIVTLDSGELVALPDIGYGLQLHTRQRMAVAATLRLANRLTVCTRHMESLLAAHGKSADVVPLGIDAQSFPPASTVPGPPWRLIHVASLNQVKDQTTLLHALRRIVDRVPPGHDIHLDIAGEDTLNGTIQALARQLQLDRHVTFHGVVPTEAVSQLFQRAHLHLVSSRHEAAGVAVLEAAASGVATVGTHAGYIADWAPERAVSVPAANPEALANAALSLLMDANARERMATAAREWTLAHDADWTAERFEDIYKASRRV